MKVTLKRSPKDRPFEHPTGWGHNTLKFYAGVIYPVDDALGKILLDTEHFETVDDVKKAMDGGGQMASEVAQLKAQVAALTETLAAQMSAEPAPKPKPKSSAERRAAKKQPKKPAAKKRQTLADV